ncbi:MAG: D-aminoacyl-tRNA deacylase [Andreesenia angusta]|nr:D-aminoacyl-tRNA deacylase [Andreesenia angusta]
MRAVVQRVNNANVNINGENISDIEKGLLIFLGVADGDTENDLNYIYDKVINLRIFEDENEKMNLSLLDIKGDILIVSQFTLCGDTRKGRRPNFTSAAKPDLANQLYEKFIEKAKSEENINRVGTGKFGANMKIGLVNDGPVTILLDSRKEF